MKRRVVHVSFSSSGGAGKVASQLAVSQRNLGWDSELVSLTSTNLRDNPFQLPLHSLLAGFDHYVNKSSKFDGLVSLSRDLVTKPVRDTLRKADIVHLHWINGVTSLREVFLAAPKAKIVWTLHDMNPFTGACHQSFGCSSFQSDCGSCPAVRPFATRAVQRSLRRKADAFELTTNLTVVSPSTWLCRLAKESRALGRSDIRVIPNPVDDLFVDEDSDSFTRDKSNRLEAGLDFCLIATDLNDPLKNVALALQAFTLFRNNNPGARLILVGRNGEAFAQLDGVDVRGELSPSAIRDVLRQSCALLLPSLAENAPVVAAEAACTGTPTIGAPIPALEELTSTLGMGGTASSAQDMSRTMGRFSEIAGTEEGVAERLKLSSRARAMFGPEKVAGQYLELYEQA